MNVSKIHRPVASLDFLTIFEHDNGGNTPNPKPSRHGRFAIGVELAQAYERLKSCCRLGEDGRHDATRTTPRCPEIDNHGDVIPRQVLLEIPAMQVDGTLA
jgi:hypothetical protein